MPPLDMTADGTLPDALADALGQVLSDARREWQRERELVEAQVEKRFAELDAKVADWRLQLRAILDEYLGKIQDGERGEAGSQGIPGERGERGEVGPPGPRGDRGQRGRVGKRGEKGERGEAGSPGATGERGTDGLEGPRGERGERGEPGSIGLSGERGEPGERGERGERGDAGPPGTFARSVPWSNRVFYENYLVTHRGSTYAALRDTAAEPPHEDWILVAERGLDAPVGGVRGLYKPEERYRKYDLVAFNGAEWRAKRDDPGELPGNGWAISAKKGKTGLPGEKGDRGERGPSGAAGEAAPTIIEWLHDGFRVVPKMSDGSTGPTLDLRGIFEQYDDEARR